MIYLLFALAAGLLVPFQTAVNSRLKQVVGSAYVSTLVSFSVSSAVLLAASVIGGFRIIPDMQTIENAPWWSWFGGVIGLVCITLSVHLFKELGQLQATVIPMFSQLLFSLCIDHFGFFDAKVIQMDGKRFAGAALLILGEVLATVIPALKNKNQGTNNKGSRQLFWQFCAVISGCLMASIGAIYAKLGRIAGSPVSASTISFLIATSAIFLFCVFSGNIKRVVTAFDRRNPRWMWLGGFCGAAAVFANSWLIPKIGAGLFVMLLYLGQLSLSILIENFGWLGAIRRKIQPVKIAGILLMLVGVALIRM